MLKFPFNIVNITWDYAYKWALENVNSKCRYCWERSILRRSWFYSRLLHSNPTSNWSNGYSSWVTRTYKIWMFYLIQIEYCKTQKCFYSSWIHFSIIYILICISQTLSINNRDRKVKGVRSLKDALEKWSF